MARHIGESFVSVTKQGASMNVFPEQCCLDCIFMRFLLQVLSSSVARTIHGSQVGTIAVLDHGKVHSKMILLSCSLYADL